MGEATIEGTNGRDPRLDDRVMDLLSEHSGRIAFNGLRRSLRVHPESLARALRRLEREGLIARQDGGYTLTDDASEGTPRKPSEPDEATRTVASVTLPAGVQGEDVLGLLAGRWFGQLRWVGIYEHPNDPWLVWSVDRGDGHVLLSARRGTLRVMVDRPRAHQDSVRLEDAAQELLVQGLTRLRRSATDTNGSVAEFSAEPSTVPSLDN